MASINAYINFLGNCEEAFNFYKSVFGGEFSMFSRFSEMPAQEGMELPKEELNKIMHVSLPIGEHTVLMGSDTGGDWAAKTVVGNNITISITADTKEQADEFFTRLSEGGAIIMPMNQTFWDSYFGMCTDKFDINWMIGSGQSMEK